MPFPYDKYPWLNFQELNLAYFIKHFREIFQQWDTLLNEMYAWKDATDADLAEWKSTVETGISSWETGLLQSMENWKDQTEADISAWEAATLSALDAWKTATTLVFEQIRTEAASSAQAAAESATSAQTALTGAQTALAGAQTAQAAAEAAAAGIQSELTQIQTNTADISDIKSQILYKDYFTGKWAVGTINASQGNNGYTGVAIRSEQMAIPESIQGLSADTGFSFLVYAYNHAGDTYEYLGYWREGALSKQSSSTSYFITELNLNVIRSAGANSIRIVIRAVPEASMDGSECVNLAMHKYLPVNNKERIDALEERAASDEQLIESIGEEADQNTRDIENNNHLTDLVTAQKYIAEDWHFLFINMADGMGLGAAHIIPDTATIWDPSGTRDLNQKGVWMEDGVHPFKGAGVTEMYARSIAARIINTPPSYRNGSGSDTPTVWSGTTLLWSGTSIPAGSDPDAGSGSGATYPTLVGTYIGASNVVNRARGSSCVRINASTGEYTGMVYSHFLRSLSRTVAECDAIAADWVNIHNKISGAPASLPSADLNTMKNHSFENLLLPYLNGTNPMPDLFVLDHGHNDVRPKGIDGENDLWLAPSSEMINDGILAADNYMANNNYANLKTALNSDLSGISDIASFAASLNRNCYKGAMNFIITVILRYNPYARIIIISDYN